MMTSFMNSPLTVLDATSRYISLGRGDTLLQKHLYAILLLLVYSKNHELLVYWSRIFEMLALFIRHLVPP